jgi:hypothetical protein
MTYPAVYASDDMRTARDTQGQLKFVSTTTTTMPSNPSSSPDGNGTDSTSNATSALIPKSSRGPAIPEKGYLVEEISDNLYWVTDGLFFGNR